jgi:putative ABC transport system permease protein
VFLLTLFKIATRNVLRNRRRSIITLIGIGLGLALIIFFQGLISGMDKQITDNFIKAQAGHIQLYAQGYKEKSRLLPLDVALAESDDLLQAVMSTPGVVSASPRIRFRAILGSGSESTGVLALAVRPEIERNTGVIAKSILEGGRYLDDQPGYVLVGKRLAKDLALHVGSVPLLVGNTAAGALNARRFAVKGIFYTGYPQYDESVVVMNLTDAQRLLGMAGKITEIVVSIRDVDWTDRTAALLLEKLADDGVELESWKESGAAIWQTLTFRRWLLSVISFIVIAIAMLGMANTMLMAVFERTREIGTMMALGATRPQLLTLFVFEGQLLGAAGGLLGSLLGGGLIKYLSIVGISPPEGLANVIAAPLGNVLYADFSWGSLLLFFVFAQVISVLAAFYPAYMASQQEPVTALRHV